MNELQIFNNPEFGKIRTVEIDGEPWLVGKDVAEALGYATPSKAIYDHIDAEDKRFEMLSAADFQNGNLVKTAIINESGLYSLVLSSKLPTAKKFKRWVTSEVLPSIRRSGSYVLSKKESEQIKQLQELQAELQEWKRLETQFNQYTANYRKAYENARANRNNCRISISRLEQVLTSLIGQLNQMPRIL